MSNISTNDTKETGSNSFSSYLTLKNVIIGTGVVTGTVLGAGAVAAGVPVALTVNGTVSGALAAAAKLVGAGEFGATFIYSGLTFKLAPMVLFKGLKGAAFVGTLSGITGGAVTGTVAKTTGYISSWFSRTPKTNTADNTKQITEQVSTQAVEPAKVVNTNEVVKQKEPELKDQVIELEEYTPEQFQEKLKAGQFQERLLEERSTKEMFDGFVVVER